MNDEQDIQTEAGDAPEADDTTAAIKALRDGGDEIAALKLENESLNRKLARANGKATRLELGTYKDELVKEFEYADPDLITGKTKQEMKASAEKLHNAVAKVIAKQGLTKGGEPVTTKKVGAEDFGQAPRAATETVSGEVPMEFAEMHQKIREGKMTRGEVLADIKANGPRVIERPTISGVVRGRATPPTN